ncbi:MAG: hypothetical protein A2163_09645 [Actinobacteria bacterium RBG_13_35_12]|nr:MAG: hypothetical protein A2163_09645 [Actinobacteria bacterium RBG_13_35_12]
MKKLQTRNRVAIKPSVGSAGKLFLVGIILLSAIFFISSSIYAYTYEDVVEYAASSECWEYDQSTMLCCNMSNRIESSPYYSQCYSVVPLNENCICVIEDRPDGGYDVSEKIGRFDANWQDRKIAIATSSTERTLCTGSCGTSWKKANCDGSPVLDTLIGKDNYYCTSAQYSTVTNYGRKCDGLWHEIGNGDCNAGCPSRINDITEISYSTVPKVYRETDGLGCNLSEWAVTPSGNCDNYYIYLLRQSFEGPPEFIHSSGLGKGSKITQRGAYRSSGGMRQKAKGGLSYVNP